MMLGKEDVTMDALNIDQQVENKYLIQMLKGNRNISQERETRKDIETCSSFGLPTFSLTKTQKLPNGSLAKAWASLKDEYDPSEGEDKIKLLEDFQNNKLLNAKVNITEWLASVATQVMKLNKFSHPINDDYLMTHILASLPHKYSSVVDHAKIDWRTNTLTLIELKKRLEESLCSYEKKKDGEKMKWHCLQAKIVGRTKLKVQVHKNHNI